MTRAAEETIDWRALRRAAEDVLPRAYAPYSKFSVAAAVLGEDGRTFVGVNVENASYGLTVCAERNAIAAAVAAGCQRFAALCVVCSGERPPSPCGACRQVITEFRPVVAVRCYSRTGDERAIAPEQLLPHAFSDDDLG